jgi:hypothetical protein
MNKRRIVLSLDNLPLGVLYLIPRIYNPVSVSAKLSVSEPLPSNIDAAKLNAKKESISARISISYSY